MLHLFEGAVLSLIEHELLKLEPSAQDFALKELKIFSDMLFKFINDKMGTPKVE